MTKDKYRVNEIFDSVQGEGTLIGVPSTFIRLQICTVGCVWCDTKYTWAGGGQLMTVEEILECVHNKHVVITGGEPTVWNLDALIEPLHAQGHYIQLETSGQQDLKGLLQPDFITWSPKENLNYDAPHDFKQIVDEVKFVIDEAITVEPIVEAIDFMYHFRSKGAVTIVLMPEGCPPGDEMINKTIHFLDHIDFMDLPRRFGWRLQYTLRVR